MAIKLSIALLSAYWLALSAQAAVVLKPPTIQFLLGKASECNLMVNTAASGSTLLYHSKDLRTWTVLLNLPADSATGYLITHSATNAAEFFRVVFWAKPIWNIGPTNISVAEGGTFTLSARVSGYAFEHWQWRHFGTDKLGNPKWNDIPGATNATVILTGAEKADAGDYDVSGGFGDITFYCPTKVSVSVTSAGGQWAVDSLADKRMKAVISDGHSPFFSSGSFIMTFARTGSTYDLDGLYTVPDSLGTYTYQKTGQAAATVTWDDALLGQGWTDLVWDNIGAGTYEHHLVGRVSYQRGRFTFQN